MIVTRRTKGPWLHRVLVLLLSIATAILFYWLLDFVVSDIGSLPGPVWAELEREHLDPELTAQQERLAAELDGAARQIRSQQERQALLRRSTDSSRDTMNQLLEVQRLGLQKGVRPSGAEQAALAESERLFLANQRTFQAMNDDIALVAERQRTLEARKAEQERLLEQARAPIRTRFDALSRSHDLRLAGLKLLFLVPLLVGALYLFLKRRTGTYAPLVYAVGITVVWKVAEVVHEYFPSRFFKYVLLAAILGLVLRVLVHLLRAAASPRRDWLLRQRREAYERFRCPSCEYPIRRGPLRFLLWPRKAMPAPQALPAGGEDAGPYTCPGCGERLYEACGACGKIRASLLPFCEGCGAEKAAA
jgi:hypothetical protein